MTVIELSPTSVGLRANFSFDGSLLVIVTGAAAGAGALSDTDTFFSRNCPIVALNGSILLPCTIAVTLEPVVGVVKPGRLTEISVVPVLVGLATKFTLPDSEPPLITTPAADRLPTLETALFTGAFTTKPPRTCWLAANIPELSRYPANTVSGVVVPWKALNVPPIPLGPEITRPKERM